MLGLLLILGEKRTKRSSERKERRRNEKGEWQAAKAPRLSAVYTLSLPPSLPPSVKTYLAHQAVQGRMGRRTRRTQIHGFLFRRGGREGGREGEEGEEGGQR